MNNMEKNIATSYAKGKAYFDESIKKGIILPCSPGFVKGSCKGGHHFAAVQYCGREYCKNCSLDGSPIHQRRTNNWFKRIKDWTTVGYLVITVPEAMRPFFFEKDILKDFRSKILRKLKKDYHIKKGLCRYHWFGDCENCTGKGCELCYHTGSGDFFHPHLNILFEGGYIEDVNQWLQPLRQWMSNYYKKIIDNEINNLQKNKNNWIDEDCIQYDYLLDIRNLIKINELVINYSYVSEDSMKMNRVKYITRSTFKRYNKDVKDLLHNFRNCIVWGWKKDEKIDTEELTKICPVCSENGLNHVIKWHKIEQFNINQKIKHYETGECRIIEPRPGINPGITDDAGFIPISAKKTVGKISRCNISNTIFQY